MKLALKRGLPFTELTVVHQGKALALDRVLIDTGSAACVFSADSLLEIGVALDVGDSLRRVRGVGGAEFVFTKRLQTIRLGEAEVMDFEVEVGAMDYGLDLHAIVGVDLLMAAHMVIDLARLELRVGG